MRIGLILLPLMLGAAPVAAQPAAQAPAELNDPGLADRLASAMQALSKAFLELPVGEVQAAVEGRKPTAAEKKQTVRDIGRRDDPNFERDFQREVAQSKPMIQQSLKAIQQALPAIMKSAEQLEQSLGRATANMPDPTYPKR